MRARGSHHGKHPGSIAVYTLSVVKGSRDRDPKKKAARSGHAVPVYRVVLRKERTIRVAETHAFNAESSALIATKIIGDSPYEKSLCLLINGANKVVGAIVIATTRRAHRRRAPPSISIWRSFASTSRTSPIASRTASSTSPPCASFATRWGCRHGRGRRRSRIGRPRTWPRAWRRRGSARCGWRGSRRGCSRTSSGYSLTLLRIASRWPQDR